MYLMHLRISEGTSDATSEGTSEGTRVQAQPNISQKKSTRYPRVYIGI